MLAAPIHRHTTQIEFHGAHRRADGYLGGASAVRLPASDVAVLRHSERQRTPSTEDGAEPRCLLCQRCARDASGFVEPVHHDFIVRRPPCATHDAAGEHDVRLARDRRTPSGWHHVLVLGARVL